MYRNNTIISISDQYGKNWDFVFNNIYLSKINIIYICTNLFKFYNITCILFFTNLQDNKYYSTN